MREASQHVPSPSLDDDEAPSAMAELVIVLEVLEPDEPGRASRPRRRQPRRRADEDGATTPNPADMSPGEGGSS
jgi:hypothetical protein